MSVLLRFETSLGLMHGTGNEARVIGVILKANLMEGLVL